MAPVTQHTCEPDRKLCCRLTASQLSDLGLTVAPGSEMKPTAVSITHHATTKKPQRQEAPGRQPSKGGCSIQLASCGTNSKIGSAEGNGARDLQGSGRAHGDPCGTLMFPVSPLQQGHINEQAHCGARIAQEKRSPDESLLTGEATLSMIGGRKPSGGNL